MSTEESKTEPLSVGLCKFAIDEGIRALDRQVGTVERLRLRAFAFVGVTATATAFLVGAALQANQRGAQFFVPLLIGTALFAAMMFELWRTQEPLENWNDQVSSSAIVGNFATFANETEAYKYLAGFYDNAVESNKKLLNDLARRVRRLSVACGALMCCWLILIWLVAS